MRPEHRELVWRMMGAMFMAFSALVVLTMIIILPNGCRQMPATRGEVADLKVEQARIDSKQSDAIASMFNIAYGQNGILFSVSPEEIKPEVKALGKHVEAGLSKAEIEAAKARDRADLAEREREKLNEAPGAGAVISGLLGALSGDFSTILDLIFTTLGIGGAVYGVRGRKKAVQAESAMGEVVDGVDRFLERDPKKAEELKTDLSCAMDRRTKDMVRAVKAKRGKK